ncbi:MAG: hypothetical protein FGM27_04940 [Candidatus Omnitrophica bacterium]|nr:hypothetical protein [Candidatus Omnitrophota bacterium]
MKNSSILILTGLLGVSFIFTGMARRGEYDEEARIAEQESKSRRGFSNPASGIAEGVRSAAVDSTAGFLSETADAAREQNPVVGTLEGARKGTGALLQNTVKGAVKVVTLGQADVEGYEVHEPEENSEEPTKFTFKIPGT